MPNPFYATITAASTTTFLADWRIVPFQLNGIIYVPPGTTVSYGLNFTLDNPNPQPTSPTPVWFPTLYAPVGSTGTINFNLLVPVHALQLVVASISGGPIYFKILQGDRIL